MDQKTRLIALFTIIILIFLAITVNKHSIHSQLVIATAGIVLAGVLFIPEFVSTPAQESLSEINSISQRHVDLPNAGSSSALTEFDNADVIEQAINPASVFQPNNVDGVTTVSSAYNSSFKLAEPDPETDYIQYSVPLDDKGYTLDEALSRKQQHTSSINKRAIDGAVRSTKNIFKRLFSNELDENEKRVWWSAESEPIEDY